MGIEIGTDKKVDIIVLNYNNWKDTIVCLESLFNLKYDNFRVIVVDNGSSDHSCLYIEKWAKGEIKAELPTFYSVPEVKKPVDFAVVTDFDQSCNNSFILLKNKVNKGYAAGNNLGIKYSKLLKTPFIWILNNDTLVREESLATLVSCYSKNPNAGLIGSKMYFFHKPQYLQGVGGSYNKLAGTGSHIGENKEDNGKYDNVKIDYPIGASIFTTREFIENVGLMNEEYFLYYEEIDWSVRALKKGYTILCCPESIIYHKEGATTGINHIKKYKSETADLYSLRNRIIFTKRYFPLYLPFVYLGFLLVFVNRIRRGQFKRLVKIINLLLRNEVVG